MITEFIDVLSVAATGVGLNEYLVLVDRKV
jgi:hypothetical protein